MREVIIVIDVLSAAALVGLVLLQQGKGADIGAAFGSGASQTLFGARGSANFLTRATAILATIFFVANMALAFLATGPSGVKSVIERVQVEQPAEPGAKPEKGAPSTAPTEPVKVPEVPK